MHVAEPIRSLGEAIARQFKGRARETFQIFY
jgi:hypothetical protein